MQNRIKTYLGEAPETHDEGFRRKQHPLYTLHLAFALFVETFFLHHEVLLASIEKARVAPTPLRPPDLLESDRLCLRGHDGEVVEELCRAHERTESEGLDGQIESGLSLNLPASPVDLVAVFDVVHGKRYVGVEELFCLAFACRGKMGWDFDDNLSEPELDGIDGRVFRWRDGGPETGRGREEDRRVSICCVGTWENIIVVEEEIGISNDLQNENAPQVSTLCGVIPLSTAPASTHSLSHDGQTAANPGFVLFSLSSRSSSPIRQALRGARENRVEGDEA